MDDEEEMRMLRQSKAYQNEKGDWANAEKKRTMAENADNDIMNEDVPDDHQISSVHAESMQNVTPKVPVQEYSDFNDKPHMNIPKSGKEKKNKKPKKGKKKREDKSDFKKAGESDSSDEDHGLSTIQQKIPDTKLIKMQRYVDHNQGSVFLDQEEDEKDKDDIINELSTLQKKKRLKAKLLGKEDSNVDNQDEDEVVPEQFGKVKLGINKKEKINLFSKVKRVKVEVNNSNLVQRHDFDIEEEEDDLVGPPIPKEILLAQEHPEESKGIHENQEFKVPDSIVENNEKGEEADEFDDIDRILLENKIPISHESILSGHSKGVVALDIDPPGNRMATGSLDEEIRLWDFQGMNRSMQSFKYFHPYEGQPIQSLSYSEDGSHFVGVTGSWQVKAYNRDCKVVKETLRGDMYIRDTFNTKGHVSTCTDGMWHPKHKNKFMT